MNHRPTWLAISAFLLASLASQAEPAALAKDELFENFTNPPDSAKPSGYWWWLNAHVDKVAITRDMEEFSAKGMGSVLLVCSGNWGGPANFNGPAFLSDEWRELYKFALKEANRCGIKVDVNIAPGWNMGGPWVTPEKSCRWFLQSETNVKGPLKFAAQLPLPGVKDGYDSPPQLGVGKSMKLVFEEVDYRDTAVVAFRTPPGKRPAPRADLPAKSNRLDADCFIPSETVMSQTLSPWTTSPDDQAVRAKDVVDLTSRMKPDGTLEWDVPDGEWTIVRTGHRMTGAQLSVPMPGQRGLENDYFDRAGVDLMFEKVGKILIADAGPLAGTTLRGFCEDSFEAGYPNWTANMLKHFKHYRGYDPTPYLPVFRGWIVGSAEESERFLYDYRKTVADCFADEHYGRLAELCRQHNMVTRCESAGPSWSGTVCMDGLKNLGRAEFPQGEFWLGRFFVENNQNKVTKQTASAAHIYGKRYAAAEALTEGSKLHWVMSPWQLKATVDRALCEGINQIVFHTMTCQRPSDGKPGNEYGAGTHFNPNVTWWNQTAGPWIGYINRCQTMLQSGQFVADVLYYNGDWAPNLVAPKHVPHGLGKGYDYDVCNAEILLTRLTVRDGLLVIPAGPSKPGEPSMDEMKYRMLVLPESRKMPVEVARKIRELVQAGATVIGPKPESDPGLKDYPTCDAEVKTIAAELWDASRVISGRTPREILRNHGIAPDFEVEENSEAWIDFIRRRTSDADLYFIFNRNERVEDVTLVFRQDGRQPEWWNPVTGQRRDMPEYRVEGGRTKVPMRLDPHESGFMVFRKPTAASTGNNIIAFEPVHDITGDWQVSFEREWFYPVDGLQGRQVEGEFTFHSLDDWSQRPETAVRHFSGTAVYRKSFVLSEAPAPNTDHFLELGKVSVSAKVRLNGRDLGVVWCAPWRIMIGPALRKGENQLEIEVVNCWPNRLIGDGKLPMDQRRTHTNIRVYDEFKPNGEKRDAPLLPSGLHGPVRVVAKAKH